MAVNVHVVRLCERVVPALKGAVGLYSDKCVSVSLSLLSLFHHYFVTEQHQLVDIMISRKANEHNRNVSNMKTTKQKIKLHDRHSC